MLLRYAKCLCGTKITVFSLWSLDSSTNALAVACPGRDDLFGVKKRKSGDIYVLICLKMFLHPSLEH